MLSSGIHILTITASKKAKKIYLLVSKQTMYLNLRPWLRGFSELFFPRNCKGCSSSLLHNETYLCRRCISNLPRTGFETWNENPVFQTFWGRAPIEFASSIYYYRKGELIQQLIHSLKYRNNREAGLFLGRIAGRQLIKSKLYLKPDYIVPVPLHPKKLRTRGYNQSELIASGLSETLGVPVSNELMMKTKHTASQTRKSHYERWENVDGIFKTREQQAFENTHILLIDDVITTGATLEACCNALLTTPGVRVSILTIGYASR